jgi:hypothetical protein
VRGRATLTDDWVSMLLDGHAQDDEPSLSELATFVRSARRHYGQPPSAGVAERHEAMIAAAAHALPAEPAPSIRPRPRRLRAALRSHPRRAVAIAAAALALALGLAGAWAVTDADRQAAPTTSDRPGTAPVPERVVSPELPSPRGEGERERARAPEGSPAPAPVAQPPPVEQSTPAGPQPDALAERPPPGVEEPVEPKAPPRRGYGGPDSTPTPLEGPLDTEPKIPAPLEGPSDTEPQIPAPQEGAPAP